MRASDGVRAIVGQGAGSAKPTAWRAAALVVGSTAIEDQLKTIRAESERSVGHAQLARAPRL